MSEPERAGRAWVGAAPVFALVTLLVCLRAPVLLRHPRLWAEEGKLYFQSALDLPWSESLVRPFRGYYALYNNVAALAAARLVPLERAPAVTTLLALGLELLPFAIILFGRSELWRGTRDRALAVAATLLVAQTGEMWLTTASSQFFFAHVTFLLLWERTEDRSMAARFAHRLVLGVAGLTGVVSCLLLPAFVLRAVRTRARERFVHAAILAAATLAQGAVLVTSAAGLHGYRFAHPDPLDVAYRLVADDVVRALLGPIVGHAMVAPGVAPGAAAKVVVVLLGTLVVALLSTGARREVLVTSTVALLFVAVVSHAASIKMRGGDRYGFTPAMILMAMVIGNLPSGREPRSGRGRLALVLLALSLSVWAPMYRAVSHPFVDPAWTRWPDEVAHWREDPTYAPKTWPQWNGRQGWSVNLGGAR